MSKQRELVILAENKSVVLVPEPATLLLLGLGTAILRGKRS